MKRFLLSKAGMISVCLVTVLMAFMLHRVTQRANAREPAQGAQTAQTNIPVKRTQGAGGHELKMTPLQSSGASAVNAEALRKRQAEEQGLASTQKESQRPATNEEFQENLSYLGQSKSLSAQSKKDKDRQGRSQIRRKTSSGVGDAQTQEQESNTVKKKGALRLRLDGHTQRSTRTRAAEATRGSPDTSEGYEANRDDNKDSGVQEPDSPGDRESLKGRGNSSEYMDTLRVGDTRSRQGLTTDDTGTSASATATLASREDLECFCPYGRPIRCELVFTLDSCMEETPLVALVMEPVYNNGQLVIPAGAELHGMARPDRLRDRIFSSPEWVLLFPRENGLANGRELRVRGLALDRAEPTADGLSWGITDGSNGLQGQIIRTLENEEIKRFAASFISASALGLQEREGTGRSGSRFTNSPTNAALQGVAATLEDAAKKIGAEIERHGVFLRVPGGKQFYFYPQQAIHPRLAMLPVPSRRTSNRD